METLAAFARRVREVPKDEAAIEQAKRAFAADWPRYAVLEVNQALVERAGEFADTFALRAHDSIQLAAAFETASVTQLPTLFACFDTRLNKAAKVLGMACLPAA
ncbi:MAG: type II toxin-antitoxin system VapC family toxin [Noviherbaspirillum sp.]